MTQVVWRRWCPTPEQLMRLQELYREGIHTPNMFQIQQISTHLSFYGKIDGKNVFYWFQNHRARERQKLKKRMPKQIQHQYLFNRLNGSSLHVQPQNHYFFKGHHHEETKALNYITYKKAVPECEEMRKPAGGSGQSNDLVGVEINPTSCYRKPLQTLDLFPITSTGLKEEKDRNTPSSTDSTCSGSPTLIKPD